MSNGWHESKFRLLIENITDAIVVNDENYNVLYQSPSVKRILGYEPEDRVGKPVLDYVHPDSKDFFLTLYEQLNEAPGVPMPFQYRVRHKLGHYVWLEGVVTNLTHDANVRAYVANYRDITERKKAEEEIQQLNADLELRVKDRTAQLEVINRDLELFSYSVSHDLRAPLRSINGFARMLEEDYSGLFDEDGKKVLASITLNAHRMDNLINDLLAFSRLGRSEVERSSCNMAEMVESVLADFPQQHANVVVEEILPAYASRDLIRQVLVNLISNAIKYSSRKENPSIHIRSHIEGDHIVYEFADNGAGFDMAYASKLFGVFQRLHSAREFEGTGVGLAIVKRIVEKHNGAVWARGEPGKGATFYFSLPVLSLSSRVSAG
jgi:PAS domain S-box-containing protein